MIRVLLVRHAVAMEREDWSKDDSLRPLTPQGMNRLRKSAAGLLVLVPRLNFVLSSPYVRARQTAEIFAEMYERRDIEFCQDLCPLADRDSLIVHLQNLSNETVENETVGMLVGHEPDLSELLSELVGCPTPFTHFKKAGAACVQFEGRVEAGAGQLEWYIPPKTLRLLAKYK